MSLVRAILRSDLTRPHHRQLRRPRRRPAVRRGQGHAGWCTRSCRSTRSRSSRTSARPAQSGAGRRTELDEGMFLLGLQAAAWRVPFLPTRVGLGSDVMPAQPDAAHRPSPYPSLRRRRGAGGRAGARARRRARATCNRGDERGNAPYLGPDPYFDDLMLRGGRTQALHVASSGSCPPTSSPRGGRCTPLQHQPADGRRRGRGAERRALHRVRARLRARRGVPEGVRRQRPRSDEAWAEFRGRVARRCPTRRLPGRRWQAR